MPIQYTGLTVKKKPTVYFLETWSGNQGNWANEISTIK